MHWGRAALIDGLFAFGLLVVVTRAASAMTQLRADTTLPVSEQAGVTRAARSPSH